MTAVMQSNPASRALWSLCLAILVSAAGCSVQSPLAVSPASAPPPRTPDQTTSPDLITTNDLALHADLAPTADLAPRPDLGTVPLPDMASPAKPDMASPAKPDMATLVNPDMATLVNPDMATLVNPDMAILPRPDLAMSPAPDLVMLPAPDMVMTAPPDMGVAAPIVPASLFGLHMKHADTTTAWPTAAFGSWRLWDAHVGWSSLEPVKGQWNWTALDRYVQLAAQHGVEPILTLGLTPTWASARPLEASGYAPGNAAEPADMNDWKTFVQTVATRYKGKIVYYELWNEPADTQFYTGTVDKMVAMGQIAFAALKAVDPNIQLVCPPTTSGDTTWIDSYFAKGGAAYTDVVGYHLYTWPDAPETFLPIIKALKAVMAKYNLQGKPLWSTEAGWLIANQQTTVTAAWWNKVLDWPTASAYLARAYALAWSNGVTRYYQYAWDDPVMGLTEADGVTVKAPGDAYRRIHDWMVGAAMSPCAPGPDATYTCAIVRANYQAWLVWNPNQTINYPLPPGTRQSQDLNGALTDLTGKMTVPVGMSPILIERF